MNEQVNRILVPTDFSENARNALCVAFQIANVLDAEISLLHIYQLPQVKRRALPHTLDQIYEDIAKEKETALEESLESIQGFLNDQKLSHVPCNPMLKTGRVQQEMDDYVSSENIDIIILGSQGHSSIENFFLGSVSSSLLASSQIPVWIIPPNFKPEQKMNQISLFTDFSRESEIGMQWLMKLCNSMNAKPFSMHVTENENAEDWKSWQSKFEGKATHCFAVDGDLLQGINTCIKEHDIDTVAIVTHKPSILDGLFNRDNARKIVYSKTIPVIGLPLEFLQALETRGHTE